MCNNVTFFTQFFFEKIQYLKKLNWANWANYEKINFFDICVQICNKLLEKLLHKNFWEKIKKKKFKLFESGQLGQNVSLPWDL